MTKRRAPLRWARSAAPATSSTHAAQIVRPPVADADDADAVPGEGLSEIVVQPVRRAEQAAHGAAAHQHHPLGAGIAVPEEREQSLERESLDVTQRGSDQHVLLGQHAQAVERPLDVRGGVGGHRVLTRARAGGDPPTATPLRAARRRGGAGPHHRTAATSCTPTGRPSAVQCSGSEIAGWPVALKGRVKAANAVARNPAIGRVRGVGTEVTERRRRRGQGGREQEIETALPPRGDAPRVAVDPVEGVDELRCGAETSELRERPVERIDVLGGERTSRDQARAGRASTRCWSRTSWRSAGRRRDRRARRERRCRRGVRATPGPARPARPPRPPRPAPRRAGPARRCARRCGGGPVGAPTSSRYGRAAGGAE